MKAQATIGFMLSLAILLMILLFVMYAISNLKELSASYKKLVAYKKACCCSLIANALYANPDSMLQEPIDCKYVGGFAVGKFSEETASSKILGELYVEYAENSFTLVSKASHYR